jgi:hypothetical protein
MHPWTQDEAIAFECAREVITDLQSILSHQIAQESAKPHPNAELIQQLENRLHTLYRERADLHVQDQDQIAAIRSEYGKRVRAWRANSISLEAVAA